MTTTETLPSPTLLTRDQQRVAARLVYGASDELIARQGDLPVYSVAGHLASARRKLGRPSSSRAVLTHALLVPDRVLVNRPAAAGRHALHLPAGGLRRLPGATSGRRIPHVLDRRRAQGGLPCHGEQAQRLRRHRLVSLPTSATSPVRLAEGPAA